MEALIHFAIWAGLFFLMMRFGFGSHVTGHGQETAQASMTPESRGSHQLRWTPPEKDTDPVCGETVRTENAKPSIHDGRAYYFCSRDCREVFEAAPALYLDNGAQAHFEMEHSHA